MTNGADAIRKTLEMLKEASLAMTPVGSGKIRQVAKPPKAPKADAAPKPVDPGESGSKSAKPPKKKAKKSSKIQDEHIEGDSHVLNFKHDDQDLTGWIEDRGDGTFDVAVVCGKFTVVKGVTKDTVVKKVKAAAAKLCGDKEIEEGKPDKAGADMLYDKDTDEKIPDNIEDNDSEETDEFWMFRGRDKKNKKKKKKVKEAGVVGALQRTFAPTNADKLGKELQKIAPKISRDHFTATVAGGQVYLGIAIYKKPVHIVTGTFMFEGQKLGIEYDFDHMGKLDEIRFGQVSNGRGYPEMNSRYSATVYRDGTWTQAFGGDSGKKEWQLFDSLCVKASAILTAAKEKHDEELRNKIHGKD